MTTNSKIIMAEVIKIENENEKQLLSQFKERVGDLQEEDCTLIRFMRARDYDLVKAEDMLRKAINWRKDNEISKILEYNVSNLLSESLPFRMCGYDNIGAPVVWLPLGRWQGRQLVEKGLKDECLKYGNWVIETAYTAVRQTGNKTCVVVMGIENLSLYQVTHLETMQTLFAGFQNLEQNYPEVLKRIYVINAPWIFTMAFNFVKPILSPHTLAKIKVFGSNKKQWLPILLQNMPQESVPKEYLD